MSGAAPENVYSALELVLWRARESESRHHRDGGLPDSNSISDNAIGGIAGANPVVSSDMLEGESPTVLKQPNATGSEAVSVQTPLSWARINRLHQQLSCPLCRQDEVLLHEGSTDARWMFVIDSPSLAAMRTNRLLAGRARQLFESILSALDLSFENVFLTGVFKCAPSDDLSQTSTCQNLIVKQAELLQPSVIVGFGEFVAQTLLKSNEPLSTMENTVSDYLPHSIPFISAVGLSEILHDSRHKARLWESLKRALTLDGLS